MTRKALNPDSLFNSLQYGFSQITVGQGSKIVTISGQVGWDEHQHIHKDDFHAQTFKAFENLAHAISIAGGTLDHVLSLRIYIVAEKMDESAPVSAALKQFFPDAPPTTSWIGVPRLANKDFLIEVEALAVFE